MKVFIVNGPAGAGKTTFESMVASILRRGNANYCFNLSTIDYVKDIAYKCGWKGTKEPKDRKFLSELKRILNEWNDSPYQDILRQVNLIKDDFARYDMNTDDVCVFIDCREPKEIKRLQEDLHAKSIYISNNKAAAQPTSNSSDALAAWVAMDYDIIISNNGSKMQLATKALNFVEDQGLLARDPSKKLVIDPDGIISYI